MGKQRAQARARREAEAVRRAEQERIERERTAAARKRRERRALLWRRLRLWQHGSGYRRRKDGIAALLTLCLVLLLLAYLLTSSLTAVLLVLLVLVIGAPALIMLTFDRRDPPEPTLTLQLLPAVDVTGGAAVRLVQGAAGSETDYGEPLEAALTWQRDGAEWIHLVDLDAAFGRGNNRALLAEVVRRLDVAVELSGGIRDDASLRAALATGAARVNLGTAALESPDWVRAAIAEFGERIAIGLDVRGTTLAARGWTQEGGDLWQTMARLDADGCVRYVVTDVHRDGTLTGPNLPLLQQVCARTGAAVVASGGVSSLDDLRAIAGLGTVEGAIVGKALYAGAFTLPEALAAVA